jgi:UDP-N-acetyl-D-mannosaminuronate dehydrogenase
LGADVRIADPHLRSQSVSFPLVELTAQEIEAADAVIVATDHDVSTTS